jgi:hypothetical protein
VASATLNEKKLMAAGAVGTYLVVTSEGSIALVIKLHSVNPLDSNFEEELPKLKIAFEAIDGIRDLSKNYLTEI